MVRKGKMKKQTACASRARLFKIEMAFAQVAQGSSKTKTHLHGLRKGFLKLKQACQRWARAN